MKELVHEIEQYQGLRALRLEGNTVGVDAARAIAKALENKDQLQVLPSSYIQVQNLNEPDPPKKSQHAVSLLFSL